jgi:hypothetical protein
MITSITKRNVTYQAVIVKVSTPILAKVIAIPNQLNVVRLIVNVSPNTISKKAITKPTADGNLPLLA